MQPKHTFVPGPGGLCSFEHHIVGEPDRVERCNLSRGVYVHDFFEIKAPLPDQMPEEHEAHLERVKNRFLEDVDRAYREGAKQHGGRLWRKPGLIRMAMKECVDQYVYLEAMLEQAENPDLLDPNEKDIDA